jgi:hypothetical protein
MTEAALLGGVPSTDPAQKVVIDLAVYAATAAPAIRYSSPLVLGCLGLLGVVVGPAGHGDQ